MSRKNASLHIASPDVVLTVRDPVTEQAYVLPVVRVEIRYGLNQVPSAVALLAVGTDTKLRPAAIHELLSGNHHLHRWPADLTIRNRSSDNAEWKTIFSGYLSGLQGRMVRGQRALSLSLVGWLSDLAISSAISASLHPEGAQALSTPLFHADPISAMGGNQSHLLGTFSLLSYADPPGSEINLWSHLLYPLCYALAQDAFQKLILALPECIPNTAIGNSPALAALRRFETGPVKPPLEAGMDLQHSRSLQIRESIGKSLFSSLRQYLAQATLASFVEMTLWDKLVMELLPSIGAMIVPLPDRALVVPHSPGARFDADRITNIPASDLVLVETAHSLHRPVQGVLVLPQNWNMVTLAQGPESLPKKAIGCYLSSSPRAGLLTVVQTPPWMNLDVILAASQQQDVQKQSSTTQQPHNQPSNQPSSSASNPIKAAWQLYARLVYLDLALRHKSLSIATVLRTDIAPGTNVKIEFPEVEGGDLGNREGSPTWFYGTVSEVQITIDAESRSAQSSFRVDYIRSQREFDNDELNMAADQHPFYQELFSGAPLVAGLDWHTN